MQKNKKLTLIGGLIVVILIGYLTFQKVSPTASLNTPINQQQGSQSRLEAVQYKTEPVGNRTRLISDNYAFEFTFPNSYSFDTAKHFNAQNPKDETVSIFTTYDENNSLNYSVQIGLINARTIERKVSEDIQGIKTSTFPSEELIDIRDADIKLQESEVTINGETSLKLEYVGAFENKVIIYYFLYNLKYYAVTVSRKHGTQFTPAQLQEIQTVINSFRFI